MKHLKLFEEFESEVINIVVDGEEKVFTIKNVNNKVLLLKNNQIFQRLDIKIPDSDDLENGEFFMASDVKQEIVDELEEQGFIEKIDKISIAGDEEVIAYKL